MYLTKISFSNKAFNLQEASMQASIPFNTFWKTVEKVTGLKSWKGGALQVT